MAFRLPREADAAWMDERCGNRAQIKLENEEKGVFLEGFRFGKLQGDWGTPLPPTSECLDWRGVCKAIT